MAKKTSRRVHTDQIIKAAAHPTRQTILKSLRGQDLSTIELEALTGENRYNLYHHLAKLQDAGLIDHELNDGRAKRYSLNKDKRTRERLFQLERDLPEDRKYLEKVLALLAEAFGEALPDPEQVQDITFLLRYRD